MKGYQKINSIPIYNIEYLLNNELDDNDIDNLLANDKLSIIYSFIVGMFKFIRINKNNNDIIALCKNDANWMYKYQWTSAQCKQYEEIWTNIIKKIYSYSFKKSTEIAQWYISIYGFQIKSNTIYL